MDENGVRKQGGGWLYQGLLEQIKAWSSSGTLVEAEVLKALEANAAKYGEDVVRAVRDAKATSVETGSPAARAAPFESAEAEPRKALTSANFPPAAAGAAPGEEPDAEPCAIEALTKMMTPLVKHGCAAALRKVLELGAKPDGGGFTVTTTIAQGARALGRRTELCDMLDQPPPSEGEIDPMYDDEGQVRSKFSSAPHPVLAAVLMRDEACLRALLDFGADPDGMKGGTDGKGRSLDSSAVQGVNPLMFLSNNLRYCPAPPRATRAEKDLRVCELLCAAGADVNVVGEENHSCALFCAQYGVDRVLECLVSHGADLELASTFGMTPFVISCALDVMPHKGPTEATIRLLVRLGAKLEPPHLVARANDVTFPPHLRLVLPRAVLAQSERHTLVNLLTYVIDNGGDAALPNSRCTPEALAKRVTLVDEYERIAALFKIGDRVFISGLTGKPKYNGMTGTVRARCNAKARYCVTIDMRDGPETIALKATNLRIA